MATMTKAATLFDHEDATARERAVAEARAQLADGKCVANDKVREWLKDLATGRRTPPPCA